MGVDRVYMTQEQLHKMRKCVTHPKIDAQTVKVTCNDGDVLEGFIEFVSDEERDVILQLFRPIILQNTRGEPPTWFAGMISLTSKNSSKSSCPVSALTTELMI
jgi:hypothetical protein